MIFRSCVGDGVQNGNEIEYARDKNREYEREKVLENERGTQKRTEELGVNYPARLRFETPTVNVKFVFELVTVSNYHRRTTILCYGI